MGDPEDIRCDSGRQLHCDIKGGWAFPHFTYVGCCQMFCPKAPKCKRLQTEEKKGAFGKGTPRQQTFKELQDLED